MADKEIMEILKTIVDNMATKDDLTGIREEIKASEARTRVFIENTITKRLDALTDGYRLNHEKQYELEREVETLKQQMDALQTRLQALEEKTA